MTWERQVACIGDGRGRGHWEDLNVGGRITLRWTLGRWGLMERTGFVWIRMGPVESFCENGNEPSVSIKKTG
jgi:hypothetical protein